MVIIEYKLFKFHLQNDEFEGTFPIVLAIDFYFWNEMKWNVHYVDFILGKTDLTWFLAIVIF